MFYKALTFLSFELQVIHKSQIKNYVLHSFVKHLWTNFMIRWSNAFSGIADCNFIVCLELNKQFLLKLNPKICGKSIMTEFDQII